MYDYYKAVKEDILTYVKENEAQKYVEENKDLIREMCNDFCNQQQIMKYCFNDDYEAIDVCLRCYVLGTAIDQAVNELESQYEDEIWKAVL